jgi:phosphopantothenoylcysteine decarboxylase
VAEDEWGSWNRLGDPVMHIDLRDWADVMVVAPLSAHTLAKFATGLCDDTLSCVVRAWDFGQSSRPGKPIILAPAMNTAMWDHPLTASHLSTFQGFWRQRQTKVPTTTVTQPNQIIVVEPQEKTLACGEVGTGALANVSDILEAVKLCIPDS